MAMISALTAFLPCRALVDEFGIAFGRTAGLPISADSTVNVTQV